MVKTDLTAARLRELLNYDPDTGVFTWRIRRGCSLAGDIAGSKGESGRLNIHVDNVQYPASRLAWLYVYGEFPTKDLRRKSKDLSDNRIDNFFGPDEKPPKRVATPLTADRLRELVDYDPLTGIFKRRVVVWKIGYVGQVIGHINAQGRVEISVDGKIYLAHRLAWLYMSGEWPKNQIDHKDGNPSNNTYENLRDVTGTENMQNQRKARSNNIVGRLGVRKHYRKWQANITVDGKIVFLGSFDTEEQAGQAYIEAKRVFHPTCTI